MRRSHETGTLVVVSDHIKSLYRDHWDDHGTLHYTGMGRKGHQSLASAQNRTLAESRTNAVDVFLFEVYQPRRYNYRGRVELSGAPYKEQQLGEDKKSRTVWMFPLRLVEVGGAPPIPEKVFQATESKRQRKSRSLADEDLFRRARGAPKKAGTQQVIATRRTRNSDVSEAAKRRAGGICQLCNQPAPFPDRHGQPFLETHHVTWLARGGEDSLENTVALCPNCHRRVHILNKAKDRKQLLAAAQES
jgi:5-methylcytosine-specific restriction protein A